MVSNLDVASYLKAYGFETSDNKTFVLQEPAIKVKLIRPSSDLYACGYSHIAISSPDKKFAKTEVEVPKNAFVLSKIIMPIMSGKLKPSTVNQFEVIGMIVNRFDWNPVSSVLIKIGGDYVWMALDLGFPDNKSLKLNYNNECVIVFKLLPSGYCTVVGIKER
jgi:hypothetical protein